MADKEEAAPEPEVAQPTPDAANAPEKNDTNTAEADTAEPAPTTRARGCVLVQPCRPNADALALER